MLQDFPLRYLLSSCVIHCSIALVLIFSKNTFPQLGLLTSSLKERVIQADVFLIPVEVEGVKEKNSRRIKVDQNLSEFRKQEAKKAKIMGVTTSSEKIEGSSQMIGMERESVQSRASVAESVLGEYLWKVRKRLEEKKYYPLIAKKMNQQGVVLAKFTISRSGEITHIESIEAHYDILSSSIRDLLNDTEMPAFPEGLSTESISVSVPIRFRLN